MPTPPPTAAAAKAAGPLDLMASIRALAFLAAILTGRKTARVSVINGCFSTLVQHADTIDAIVRTTVYGDQQQTRVELPPVANLVEKIRAMFESARATKAPIKTEDSLAQIICLLDMLDPLASRLEPWVGMTYREQKMSSAFVSIVADKTGRQVSVLQRPDLILEGNAALFRLASLLAVPDIRQEYLDYFKTFEKYAELLKNALHPSVFEKKVGMTFEKLVEELQAARSQVGDRSARNSKQRRNTELRALSVHANKAAAALNEAVVSWIGLARTEAGVY